MKNLKTKLNNLIKQRGEISYNELKQKVESGYFNKYYKTETMARSLRELCEKKNEVKPNVAPIVKNGTNVAYKWIGERTFKTYRILGDDGKVEKSFSVVS